MDIRIKEYIQKGVDSLTRDQGEKDFRKQLAEDVKEKFDISSTEFNARVKIAFDKYEAKQKRDIMTDRIDEVESLGF